MLDTHIKKPPIIKRCVQDLPWLFKLPVSEKVEFKEIHCRRRCWWLKSSATWFYMGYWDWACPPGAGAHTSGCCCQEAATWSRQADRQRWREGERERERASRHTHTHTREGCGQVTLRYSLQTFSFRTSGAYLYCLQKKEEKSRPCRHPSSPEIC